MRTPILPSPFSGWTEELAEPDEQGVEQGQYVDLVDNPYSNPSPEPEPEPEPEPDPNPNPIPNPNPNQVDNPEQYTGYSAAAGASRVWD